MEKIKIIAKKREPEPVPAQLGPMVISFDIGIINLAYCRLQYGEGKFHVATWGIINLADGIPTLKCYCKKPAFYKYGETKVNGLCQPHARGKTGISRNMTAANVTEYELKMALFRQLDSDPLFLQADVVLIECQPQKARDKMRNIGTAIFDYYVLRGTIDRGKNYDIRVIDAKNKLTVYDGPPISCHLKTQYARNKWYSVRYCEWALQHEPGWLDYFQKYKKRDDLADCFLQGAWWLKFGKNGQRGDITTAHQRLVNNESNSLKYQKVRAHAPSKKILANGRYTLSNLKYLLTRKGMKPDEPQIRGAVEFYFGTVDEFLRGT